jgi:hypothetical protein
MKILVSALMLFFVLTSFAHVDTTKVEQYCEVVATSRMMSNKVTIDINYCEQRSIWRDHRVKDDEGKLVKFNSVVDALNYLGKEGWKMVNAFPIQVGSGPAVYHYVFKKVFPKSDTAADMSQ